MKELGILGFVAVGGGGSIAKEREKSPGFSDLKKIRRIEETQNDDV